jgi:hypothetical protein
MKLAARLTLALLVGAAGLGALAHWVGARDAAAAARAGRAASAGPLPRAERLALPLGPPVGFVWIATDLLELPVELAPVVAIDALGGARLLRGAVPMARGDAAPAGLVVPVGGIDGLSPDARATLLAILGQLLAERPVRAEQVRALGAVGVGTDLRWLLGWLR